MPRRRLKKPRLCLGCLAPLKNGRSVCSDECDESVWKITPTKDGELWDPSAHVRLNESLDNLASKMHEAFHTLATR
jgi:hypothetical protein